MNRPASYFRNRADEARVTRVWTALDARLDRRQRRQRWQKPLALACSAAAVLALAWYSSQRPHASDPTVLEIADGSRVEHPREARVEVMAVTPERVELRLTRGRAEFSVRPNRARSFLTHAGEYTVRVVGTVFAVELEASGLQVAVTRGEVEVRRDGTSDVWRVRAGERWASKRLTPSAQLARTDHVDDAPPARAEAARAAEPGPGSDTTSSSIVVGIDAATTSARASAAAAHAEASRLTRARTPRDDESGSAPARHRSASAPHARVTRNRRLSARGREDEADPAASAAELQARHARASASEARGPQPAPSDAPLSAADARRSPAPAPARHIASETSDATYPPARGAASDSESGATHAPARDVASEKSDATHDVASEKSDATHAPTPDALHPPAPSRDAAAASDETTALFQRAQQAREASRPAEAAQLLARFLQLAPHDPRVGLAAFQLGRTRLELQDPAGALAAFDVASRAGSAFSEQIAARRVQALEQLGQTGACRQARSAYLRAYPDGAFSAIVRQRCP